ncbi:MAG: DUF5119 domain-containing protein [Alistipes sp.]
MKRTAYILSLWLMLLAVGCKRLPLFDESGALYLDLSIDLNIAHQPDIAKPETMLVSFFDSSTQQYVANNYVGPHGGVIDIASGRYDILVYNFGTEKTLIRNADNLSSAEAYTDEVGFDIRSAYETAMHHLTASAESDESATTPIVFEPDHLFVGRLADAEIPVRTEGEESVVVHIDASTVLKTYSITIGPITGGEYVQSAEIFLTGQVRSNFIWRNEQSNQQATLYFPIGLNDEKSKLCTTFNTFGKFPGADNKVYLNIIVVDTGGGRYYYNYNVTDQFDNPENVDCIISIDDTIDIPEPSHGGGGFRPDISDWDDETHDIEL